MVKSTAPDEYPEDAIEYIKEKQGTTMKRIIHLRADSANGKHTRFTVFVNGANCGQLCMLEDEAILFHDALTFGRYLTPEEIVSSGFWTDMRVEHDPEDY